MNDCDGTSIRSADLRAGQRLKDSARQIEAATAETRAEIDSLTHLVVALAKHASNLGERLKDEPESPVEPGDLSAMRDEVSSLDAAANKTITRLHFAERLEQRLVSVQLNLEALTRWFEHDRHKSKRQANAAPGAASELKDGSRVTYLPAMPRRKRDLH